MHSAIPLVRTSVSEEHYCIILFNLKEGQFNPLKEYTFLKMYVYR
jgi:hypothetical protein